MPKSLSVPRTSVYYNLEVSATRYPDKAAIDYYGREVSYAQLRRAADALAGWLQQRCGVKQGDRVLLYAQNGVHFIAGYYGILRADAVVVPVNPMNLTEELEHYVEDAGARVLLTTQELAPRATSLLRPGMLEHAIVGAHAEYLPPQLDLPVPDFVRAPLAIPQADGVTPWSTVMAAGLEPGRHRAGPDDLAVMPYTSGTTGKPKGCMHTHSTVLATSTGILRTGADHRAAPWCSRCCRCFTSPACRRGMNIADSGRRQDGRA